MKKYIPNSPLLIVVGIFFIFLGNSLYTFSLNSTKNSIEFFLLLTSFVLLYFGYMALVIGARNIF